MCTDAGIILNQVSVSLQGKNVNSVVALEKVRGFQDKLCIYLKRIGRENYQAFERLTDVMDGDESGEVQIKDGIVSHLYQLKNAFDGYFSEGCLTKKDMWIRDPFMFNVEAMEEELAGDVMEELCDMRKNSASKIEFDSLTLDDFWAKQLAAFPVVAKKALSVIVPFAPTYLCESGFSTLAQIKTKARNKLNVVDDMMVALATIPPRLQKLVAAAQEHPSH